MKYLDKLNGTTKVILTLIAITGAVYTFDTTYARASDVQAVQESATMILDVLKLQYITRKAVLELKRAEQGLTPAEVVELQGLVEILAKLEK